MSWADGVLGTHTIASYLVTGIVWVPLIVNGIFYPVFDADNLKNSWGGPTLAGAWVTHFAIGIGVLFGVALPFALLKSHTLPSGDDHAAAGVDGPDGAESWPPSD